MTEKHIERLLKIAAVIMLVELLLLPTAVFIGFAVRLFLWASGLGR